MDAKIIGKKLKDIRVTMGESQEDVAGVLGITASAVSQYESGLRIPSDDLKVKYAGHFGKTVQFLFYQ